MKKYTNLIDNAFTHTLKPCENPSNKEEWARLGLFIAFQLYHMIRKWRFQIHKVERFAKNDGSPTTNIEMKMEQFARQTLKSFYPDALFMGEETGGDPNTDGYLFVIDPVDGTRSFLSGFETYSITLAILKKKAPVFSLVCSPSSGDIYFRIGMEPSVLLQIPTVYKRIDVTTFPLIKYHDEMPILVNLHPSRIGIPYMNKMYELWNQGEIQLVRSVSGSPSLLMVEAAKTGTFYMNTWNTSPTKPYDLIPGLHIINSTNCLALRSDGNQLDAWNHQGVYVVGPNGNNLNMLMEEVVRL